MDKGYKKKNRSIKLFVAIFTKFRSYERRLSHIFLSFHLTRRFLLEGSLRLFLLLI